MKQLITGLVVLFAGVVQAQAQPAVIPAPVLLQQNSGSFVVGRSITVSFNTNGQALALNTLTPTVNLLKTRIATATGLPVTMADARSKASIQLQLLAVNDTAIGPEGYYIDVTTTGMLLKANTPAGIFYGVQTLLQLFPPAIESKTKVTGINWSVPAVHIMDYPRFAWRGMMLDVARHFFNVAQVKQFVDQMVKYKYNVLHLHLADDQGWRVEIKGLLKLTEVGAWNVGKTGGDFGNFSPPLDKEPRTAGGFFTQDDIRELVKYCKERFVNILPEIDVPGHSMALVASYPELSGTPGKYKVNSGENFIRFTHPESTILEDNELITDNTVSPAKEEVYVLLDKVFTQLAELFPFGYIHMGGDECIKNFWKDNAGIKALMQRENLTNLDQVQSYFVNRVEKIISSKGKRMIGWDEILQENHSSNAVIMSWRGMDGAIAANKKGQEVVMAPCETVYLDLMQGDSAIETPVYSTVRLRTAYDFEPVPQGCNPALIKGGQANLWTEKIYNMRHMQYMLWPRAFAVAEALWSPAGKKDWPGFITRVEAHFKRCDYTTVKYATSLYEPMVEVSKTKGDTLLVNLRTEVDGLNIHYSFDNSYPDEFYPMVRDTLVIPKDLSMLRVITYRNGKPIGRMMSVTRESLLQRAASKKPS